MAGQPRTKMDTSEVDKWVGVPLGGGQFREAVHINDVRRWAQGMQNANPLYYDADYAAQSVFGQIVAPAVVHRELHGGPRRGPGDPGLHRGHAHALRRRRVVVLRPAHLPGRPLPLRPHAASTTWSSRPSSPAPRCSRAATPPTSTSAARSWRGSAPPRSATTPTRRCAWPTTRQTKNDPEWTDAQLEDLEKQKREYIRTVRDLGHEKRLFVKAGEKLTRRPIGPHTIMSFTTEWRAYTFTVWGSSYDDGSVLDRQGRLDPRHGPRSRGRARSIPPRATACTRARRAATRSRATRA